MLPKFRITGNDPEKNISFMKALNGEGKYGITEEMQAQLKDFPILIEFAEENW